MAYIYVLLLKNCLPNMYIILFMYIRVLIVYLNLNYLQHIYNSYKMKYASVCRTELKFITIIFYLLKTDTN